MKKKIILYGHLKEKYPHPIEVEASSVAEAMQALSLIKELQPPAGVRAWPVTIENVNSEIAVYSETKMEEIHVYPRVEGGGGKGGMLQILIGVVLIATGFGIGLGTSILGGALTGGSLFVAGATMVLGGLVQALLPNPDISMDVNNSESSRYLGAQGNTVRIGTRIAVGYGNQRVGGHYLSFDVDAVEWAGDSNPLGSGGSSSLVGQSVYVEHDKPAVQPVPVNPIFSSPVTGPTNIPVDGWSPS